LGKFLLKYFYKVSFVEKIFTNSVLITVEEKHMDIVEITVKKAIQKVLFLEGTINMNQHLTYDFDMDSTELVELEAGIRKELKIDQQRLFLAGAETVADVVGRVRAVFSVN
jgi:acyl carrier protein